MSSPNEVIPYTRIDQVIEVIKGLSNKPQSIRSISSVVNIGKSNIKNTLPTLVILDFVVYDKGNVNLTETGSKMRSALLSENEGEAKKILRNKIGNVDPLVFVKELLDKEKSVSIDEIGKKLALKYNKNWEHPLTRKTYAAACASIVSYAGYGIYEGGVLRIGEGKIRQSKIVLPSVTYKKILKIIDAIYKLKKATLDEISKKTNTSKSRLVSELSTCEELKLVNRLARGYYKVTELGVKLVNPLEQKNQEKNFRKALLESRYIEIISKLDGDFDSKWLGKILSHFFGGDWGESTQLAFGKKFTNLLKYAGLLDKKKQGKYSIKEGVITVESDTDRKEFVAKKKIMVKEEFNEEMMKYYELGKISGLIMGKEEEREIDERDIDNLIQFCTQNEKFNSVTELIEDHKRLFKTIQDSRIFIGDLKLLEKILKSD